MVTAVVVGAVALLSLAAYLLYGLTKHTCAICAKPVRERQAEEWCTPDGATVYTHHGTCTVVYGHQHAHDFYRPVFPQQTEDK